MSRKCMKCGYVRQDSDIAPDYECPKCGVVYVKANAVLKHPRESAEYRGDIEEYSPPEKVITIGGKTIAISVVVVIVLGVSGWSYQQSRKAEQAKAVQLAASIRAQQEAQRRKQEEESEERARLEEIRAQNEEQRADHDLIENYRGRVVSRLKDPSSVQFRDLRLNTSKTALCGEYNAKNSYGGYVGFSRFIVTDTKVMIENKNSSSFESAQSYLDFVLATKDGVCR